MSWWSFEIYIETMVDRSVNTDDKCNDSYFAHRSQEQRHRYSSGNRPREHGRTFYNRRTQQRASETSTFNTKGQKTLSQDFSNQDVDRNFDHSWQDKPMNGRTHPCSERFNKNISFKNGWHEQNGYRRNYNARGCRSHASDSHRQQSKTASAVSDCDSDLSPPASTETTSVCSSSSLTSVVVPLPPNVSEDHGEELLPQNLSNGNVWKERLEFYHSAQPRNEEEEDLMMKRALEESQKLEEERQQQILEETASRVRLLSMDEDQHKEVIEESNVVTSTSTPADVVGVSVSTACDPEILPSGNCMSMIISTSTSADVVEVSVSTACDPEIVPSGNCMSTSSPGKACTVREMSGLEDLTRPSAFIVGVSEPESLHLLNKSGSGDVRSPCGLVAFCQSETSAFTSLVTAKHVNLPVVVQGCDEHLHSSCSSRSSHSSTSHCTSPAVYVSHDNASVPQMGYPVLGDEESTPNLSLQSSNYNDNSFQPFSGSDEPAQSFTEDPMSKCDVASSSEQNSSLLSTAEESLLQEQPVSCVNSAQTLGDCNEGLMACGPHRIPVPVPGLLPCYHSPMLQMTSSYPQPVLAYMTPLPPAYPSGISVIQSYPFPAYPVMPPPGMMPPVGIVQMSYPPFPPSGPCYVQPSVMCHTSSLPLQTDTPEQPLPPR